MANDIAFLMPSSPCTIIGLRPRGQYMLEQWWSRAKRHAFRHWPYLINNATGIFLVTKCVKTHRYVHCLSQGPRGQSAQIHIHGMMNVPRSNDQIELPVNGTSWQIARNELNLRLHDSVADVQYTIFIERDASSLFTLTDMAIREAAHRLWESVFLFLKRA